MGYVYLETVHTSAQHLLTARRKVFCCSVFTNRVLGMHLQNTFIVAKNLTKTRMAKSRNGLCYCLETG